MDDADIDAPRPQDPHPQTSESANMMDNHRYNNDNDNGIIYEGAEGGLAHNSILESSDNVVGGNNNMGGDVTAVAGGGGMMEEDHRHHHGQLLQPQGGMMMMMHGGGDGGGGEGNLVLRPIFCGNLSYGCTATELENVFRNPPGGGQPFDLDRVDLKRGYAFVFLKDPPNYAERRRCENFVDEINGMHIPQVSNALRTEFARGDGRVKKKEDERRKKIMPNETLFVVNFHEESTKREDLEMLFSPYGELVRIDMKRNYAFVQFKTVEEAIRARDGTNGGKLDQSEITVEYVARRMGEGGGGRGGGDRDDRRGSGGGGRRFDDRDRGGYRGGRGGGGRDEYRPRRDDYRPRSGGGGYRGDRYDDDDNRRSGGGYRDDRRRRSRSRSRSPGYRRRSRSRSPGYDKDYRSSRDEYRPSSRGGRDAYEDRDRGVERVERGYGR